MSLLEKLPKIVETKAQRDVSNANVQRKLKAAALYCQRINSLTPKQRNNKTWGYALVGESIVEQYIKASGSVSDVLSYAKVRQTIQADQQKLI